jgi:uridine kinase
MMVANTLNNADLFCEQLNKKMKLVAPVVGTMESYEFRYCLNTITPENAQWNTITVDPVDRVEALISSPTFFDRIEIKPRVDGKIVLDKTITRLTQMLFVGLVTGDYKPKWISDHFYFDPRSFNFYVKSIYVNGEIKAHLGGKPYKAFEQKQRHFELRHEVGYRDFLDANAEVDNAFIECILKLVKARGVPVVLAIAGPTAAGKTEIVDRLRAAFEKRKKNIAAIELDNFLTDRDGREEKGIGSFGKEALHFQLFQACIHDILNGKSIATPRYDFIDGTSSHTDEGKLKPGRKPVEIEPADIIFIEGNSPFLLPEIAPLIGIKIVYLTDDAVRLKRKWRRDIDYRKKYDPYYLRNRYFKEQVPMVAKNYQPQLNTCDIFVDTTSAELWVTPEIKKAIETR